MFETITTIIKTIVGSGIISLPYTVSAMGWLFSIIIFLIVGVTNHYLVYILLKSKNLSKHSTYNSIAYHIYKSKVCTFLLSFINMFANVGFGIFYMIKIGGNAIDTKKCFEKAFTGTELLIRLQGSILHIRSLYCCHCIIDACTQCSR